MFKFILFLNLSLINVLHAEVLKHEISAKKLESFSFKEVCEKLGAKNLEMIEAKSMSEIDCMGKTFPAIDFCLNKYPIDMTLTRAIVNEKEKIVQCEKSTSVMLSISCDKRDLKYCLNPKKGCEALRKIYAYRLEVAHYSMLEKNINCYFTRPLGDSINEVP